MLTVWRMVKAKYAATAMDGEGARQFGGRWTSEGRRAVYTSGSVALATLEIVAHLDATGPLPAYVLIAVRVPARLVTVVDVEDLPPDWRIWPAPASTRVIGDRWLDAARHPVLRVPSALVPVESNYVLNPAHPAFARLAIAQPVPFTLDARLR